MNTKIITLFTLPLFTLLCSPTTLVKARTSAQPTFIEAGLTNLSCMLCSKKAELFNDLDYLSSKGIDLEFTLLGERVNVSYKARWGYRGPGSPDEPFTGFRGKFSIPVTLAKGLIIDPLQADKVKEIIRRYNLQRLVKVSPIDEFRLKCLQLVMALSRDDIDPERFWNDVKILVQRFSITPGHDGFKVGDWLLIGTAEQSGYFDTLFRLPESQISPTKIWLIKIIKTVAPLLGLTSKAGDPHALKQLLQRVDYLHDHECILADKNDQLAKISFGYHSSGNGAAPFTGCLINISLPIADAANAVFERVEHKRLGLPSNFSLTLPLSPTYECLVKICMVFASAYNGNFEKHRVPEEIETLVHRLLITPGVKDIKLRIGGLHLLGTEEEPGLLRIISNNAHEIMRHDFDTPDTSPLTETSDVVKLIAQIFYRAAINYTSVQTDVRKKLAQTPDGQTLCKHVETTLEAFKQEQTSDTQRAFQKAYGAYRKAELLTGRKEFENVINFVIDEIARGSKRLITFELLTQSIKSVPFISEFEESGVRVDLSRFWQIVGQKEGEAEDKKGGIAGL